MPTYCVAIMTDFTGHRMANVDMNAEFIEAHFACKSITILHTTVGDSIILISDKS